MSSEITFYDGGLEDFEELLKHVFRERKPGQST